MADFQLISLHCELFTETCRPDEFDCEDSTCIDIGLKCDGVDNCKYRYDEDKQTTCAPGNRFIKFD